MKYSKKFQRLVRQTIKEKFEPMLKMDYRQIRFKSVETCSICDEYHCSEIVKMTCPIAIEFGSCYFNTPFKDLYWGKYKTTRTARSHVRKVIKWLKGFLKEE